MKQKKKPWDELKEERCPKCNSVLMQNAFFEELVGCSCGFMLDKNTKDLLVNRDFKDNGSKL